MDLARPEPVFVAQCYNDRKIKRNETEIKKKRRRKGRKKGRGKNERKGKTGSWS